MWNGWGYRLFSLLFSIACTALKACIDADSNERKWSVPRRRYPEDAFGHESQLSKFKDLAGHLIRLMLTYLEIQLTYDLQWNISGGFHCRINPSQLHAVQWIGTNSSYRVPLQRRSQPRHQKSLPLLNTHLFALHWHSESMRHSHQQGTWNWRLPISFFDVLRDVSLRVLACSHANRPPVMAIAN